MNRVKELLRQEDGNTALFLMGMIGIMMIMFVFVFNLAQVFAVKEQANTTAQQASLAATSVLYNRVWEKIKDHSDVPAPVPLPVPVILETIEEKVDNRILDLNSNPRFSKFSNNEIRLEAIDQVVTEELEKPQGRIFLKPKIEAELPYALSEMQDAVRETILANGGNTSEAKMFIKDNQIHVKASNTVEGTAYGKFFGDLKEKLFQESAGPEVKFLEKFPGYEGYEASIH
ncbi:pilus assembly protein TadG-related protein [Neobacillus sp. SCS-31]|uniref:pilus assembly protein TadG-related protein n=1 Tax=Neobacillus oceani TaxID=3115292 RepID=UPI003905BB74